MNPILPWTLTILLFLTSPTNQMDMSMDQIAESYVKLVLAVGTHDPDFVDAYYGPPEWRENVQKLSMDEMLGESDKLLTNLEQIATVARFDEMGYLRLQYLTKQTKAVRARVEMLNGKKFSFDEEAAALYDATPPRNGREFFEDILAKLDKALPKGSDGTTIQERYEVYRSAFVIPKEKLDAVFTAAIEECRKRTKAHLTLPEAESFVFEFVNDKPWSGYNWYKGKSQSLIQVNTDLPIFIDRAIDLAAHEGYPGHHVYNALLEENLVTKRGWLEFTVYPLFSPQSLIAEGSANFGVHVVFPGEDRIAFESKVLFPLAGLDGNKARDYYEVFALTEKLNYAGNEAAREYLNGAMSRTEAVKWLVQYQLMSPDRAEQRVKFIEKYRSYVINYNLGQDLVRSYIESRGGVSGNPEKRWKEFGDLISSPRLPSGLQN